MKELESIKLQLSNIDPEVRINALFDAYEYDIEGLNLIIQALADESRKVRQAALIFLAESKTETARQALWNYLPFSKMQCLRTIEEFNLECCQSKSSQPDCLVISNQNNILVCYWRLGSKSYIFTWSLTNHEITKYCSLQYAEKFGLGNNGKNALFSYDDLISFIEINQLEDFGNEIIDLGGIYPNHFTIGKQSTLIAAGSRSRLEDYTLEIKNYKTKQKILSQSFKELRLSTHHINTGDLWQRKVSPLLFTPDDKILVAHFVPNRLHSNIKLWEVQSGKLIQTSENLPKLSITSVGVRPDETIIACGIREEKICAWELQTDKIVHSNEEMSPCILSDDGRVLIYATDKYEIVVRDLVLEQELCRLTGHNAPIAYITLSTDYEFIASYSTDKQIKIWGMANLDLK